MKDEIQIKIQCQWNEMSCVRKRYRFLWHVNLFRWQCLYLTSRLFRHSLQFYPNKALFRSFQMQFSQRL